MDLKLQNCKMFGWAENIFLVTNMEILILSKGNRSQLADACMNI